MPHHIHPCATRRRWLAGVARVSSLLALGGFCTGPLRAAATPIDINGASEADLDSLDGVGPALTARILAQRAQAPFADWADLMRRVKGIRMATARRLANQGVTVNGQPLAPLGSPVPPVPQDLPAPPTPPVPPAPPGLPTLPGLPGDQ